VAAARAQRASGKPGEREAITINKQSKSGCLRGKIPDCNNDRADVEKLTRIRETANFKCKVTAGDFSYPV